MAKDPIPLMALRRTKTKILPNKIFPIGRNDGDLQMAKHTLSFSRPLFYN
jgi:hypothetical protein